MSALEQEPILPYIIDDDIFKNGSKNVSFLQEFPSIFEDCTAQMTLPKKLKFRKRFENVAKIASTVNDEDIDKHVINILKNNDNDFCKLIEIMENSQNMIE